MILLRALKALGKGINHAYRWYGRMLFGESVDPVAVDPAERAQLRETGKQGRVVGGGWSGGGSDGGGGYLMRGPR
jgi:hypothetical protein